MKNQKRIRDYGFKIGNLNPGRLNSITDVDGVRVGHVTLDEGNIKTGVTAVLPHEGNIFTDKVMAACNIINGFGKTIGTVQIEELGTIETPIILTNTLSVGKCADALIKYSIGENKDIGVTTGTVNPIVGECNDGYLNNIRGCHIKEKHVFQAINNSGVEFEEGDVGAGKGMSCYDLKGGIGTSSRIVNIKNQEFTLGVLTLTNFGKLDDLIIDGIKAGKIIKEKNLFHEEEDKGSVMIILATDIPLSERQLKRVLKRTSVGLARTGSYIGNGSGDIVIGFTTVNRINHYEKSSVINIKILNENEIDNVFRGAIEAIEEAVLNSMICANTVKGRDGHIRYSLKEYIDKLI